MRTFSAKRGGSNLKAGSTFVGAGATTARAGGKFFSGRRRRRPLPRPVRTSPIIGFVNSILQ